MQNQATTSNMVWYRLRIVWMISAVKRELDCMRNLFTRFDEVEMYVWRTLIIFELSLLSLWALKVWHFLRNAARSIGQLAYVQTDAFQWMTLCFRITPLSSVLHPIWRAAPSHRTFACQSKENELFDYYIFQLWSKPSSMRAKNIVILISKWMIHLSPHYKWFPHCSMSAMECRNHSRHKVSALARTDVFQALPTVHVSPLLRTELDDCRMWWRSWETQAAAECPCVSLDFWTRKFQSVCRRCNMRRHRERSRTFPGF